MAAKTSGELLRDARVRAGLTQAQLAERANITQSVISAYEHGRRQPALSTLVDLVFATGLELDIQIRPQRRPIDRMTGPIGRNVRSRRRQLVKIATEHGLKDLRVFGSVARGDERVDSDLDLLVDVPDGMGMIGLGRARQALEDVVGTTIDLVPSHGLKPDIAAQIERDLIPL